MKYEKAFPFNFILLHCMCIGISLVQGRYFIKALLLIFFFRKKKNKKKRKRITHNNPQFIVQTLYMIHILLVCNIRKGFLGIQLSYWNNFITKKKTKKTVIIFIISQNRCRLRSLEDNPCTQTVIYNHNIRTSVLLKKNNNNHQK